jgi:type I restriction enzyme, S subunit
MKWQETEFENIYSIPSKNGLTRPSATRGLGYKFINMGELFAHGRIGLIDMERVQMNEKELDSMLVEEGDLLFARQSLVLAGAGKCSIIQKIDEPTTFESHIIRVRLRKDIVEPSFFYYYFNSPICRIKSIVTQGVQAGIRANDLKKLKVHVPSLETQQKIADILSKYDDLIENNRRRIELLEESARLLYREWFVYLRFPGHEHTPIIDGIPEGWEKKKIEDICETVGGGTPSTNNPEYWNDGDITWVVPTDITKNDCLALLDSERKITEAGLKKSSAKLVPPETILMTSRASVGFFAVMDKEVCTNQGFINIIPYEENRRMYILYNLMYRVEEIRSHAGGSTYTEISKSRFRNLDILIPSNTLLQQFQEQTYQILQQVRLLNKQIAKLQQARDILIPRLMNREIAV